MIAYDNIDQIVSTTHTTVNKLLEYRNGPDALILYFRYIQQMKMQMNSNTYSTDVFMMEAMWRWDSRFKSAKNILVHLKLIQPITKRDEAGRIVGHYVKVKFIVQLDKPDLSTSAVSHPVEEPPSGEWGTNTLEVKRNTLAVKTKTKEPLDLMYVPLTEIRTKIKEILSEEEITQHKNSLFCLCYLINAGLMLHTDKKRLINQCWLIEAYYDSCKFTTDNREEIEKLAQQCWLYNLGQIDAWKKKRDDINYLSSLNTFITKRYAPK